MGSFYDFLPYKYGPFSFQMYRDVGELERCGYITTRNDSFCSGEGQLANPEIERLPEWQKSCVKDIVTSYSALSQSSLIADVYSRYPWYAVRSELDEAKNVDLPEIPVAEPAVYTAGYEGKSLDSFLDSMLRRGIRCIVDVRKNPLSRKYGFSKSTLEKTCPNMKLKYVHYEKLGVPSEHRKDINTDADVITLLDWYETRVLDDSDEQIRAVAETMARMPSLLLCYEANAAHCHRSRLAQRVAQVSGLSIKHM